jgi:hypothetical protein
MCISRMVFVHATLFLLSASAMGCAAGSHGTEYRQAAFTPPPPAPLRPGVGAPVLGQPGQPQAVMPRSPHRRVLPPTREPGVWAGDQPRAAGFEDVKDVEPLILGVRLPYINEPPLHETETWPVRWCAAAASTVIDLRVDRAVVAALTQAEKGCVAALLYATCARREHEETRNRENLSERLKDLLAAMHERAKGFLKEKCDSDSHTPRVDEVEKTFASNWNKVGP